MERSEEGEKQWLHKNCEIICLKNEKKKKKKRRKRLPWHMHLRWMESRFRVRVGGQVSRMYETQGREDG